MSSLAYGQLWQGILPRTSVLAVDCPSQGCMSQQLAIVCAPPSGQGLVAPKAVTFGFMAGAMLMTFETLGTCGVR